MENQIISWLKNLWHNSARSKPKNEIEKHFGNSHQNEFIVIGLGRFGTSLAMSLTAYSHDVLAIDTDMKRVQYLASMLPHVIQLDATDMDALSEVGAEAFDTAIVCIGSDFEANLLTTVTLKKIGVRRVIAKARTITQQDILLRVGAEEVILPEHEAGVRLARRLASIDFVDFMELSHDTGVIEILAPDQLLGKSLREAEIRHRYGLAVVAIKRGLNEVIISPQADEVIQAGDLLVVLGRTEDCERLR